MLRMFFPPVISFLPFPQMSPQEFTYQINIFDSIRRGGCVEVKFAIETGKIHVNHRNAQGHTLLISAICYRQIEIAKYLIFLGADLETPDPSGKSARGYIQELKVHQLYNIDEVIASFCHDLALAEDEHYAHVEVVGESGCCC